MSSSFSTKKISRKTKKISNSSWIVIKKGHFPSSCLIMSYQLSSEKRTNLHLAQVAAHRRQAQAFHHVFTADFCKDTVVAQNTLWRCLRYCLLFFLFHQRVKLPLSECFFSFLFFFFVSTSLIFLRARSEFIFLKGGFNSQTVWGKRGRPLKLWLLQTFSMDRTSSGMLYAFVLPCFSHESRNVAKTSMARNVLFSLFWWKKLDQPEAIFCCVIIPWFLWKSWIAVWSNPRTGWAEGYLLECFLYFVLEKGLPVSEVWMVLL